MSLVGSKAVDGLMVPVRKPLAERAVRHEPDAEFLAGGEHARFGAAPPQRVFALHGGHGLHGVGAADGGGGGLGHAEVLDLPGGDEVLDRAGDVFDRDLRVDAMRVVQVDGVDAEAVQGSVDDVPDDIGVAGDPAARLAFDGVDVPAELGGDDHLAGVGGERFTDEFLVGVGP